MHGTAYQDIPEDVRKLLDQTYTPEGVEVWWNSPNKMLDGLRPSHLWLMVSRQDDVRMIADMLSTGGYT